MSSGSPAATASWRNKLSDVSRTRRCYTQDVPEVPMIDDLKTPERASQRLVHDTMVHLVRQSGPLRLVRVAIPEAWDAAAFAADMAAGYAARGFQGVEVTVLTTAGEPRLLSVNIG